MWRGAGVDAQNFGYLRPFGAGTGANFERRARRHAAVAAALDDAHMQEGIAGSVGKLNKAETLVGVVPFDDGLDRGAGGRVKPLGAELRRRSEIAPGRFVVIVVETTATGRTKISVSAAHVSAWGRMERPHSEMRRIDRQRIPAAAGGLRPTVAPMDSGSTAALRASYLLSDTLRVI